MRSPNLGHIFQYFTCIENKLSSDWVLLNPVRLGYFLAGRLTGEIMPRIAKELSALEVKRLSYAGTGQNQTVAVGGVSGLLMQLIPNGGRSWVLRTLIGGKRKEFGLGSFPEISLAAARDRARDSRKSSGPALTHWKNAKRNDQHCWPSKCVASPSKPPLPEGGSHDPGDPLPG